MHLPQHMAIRRQNMKQPSFISIIELAFIKLKLLVEAQADGRMIRKQSILPALLPEKGPELQ